MPACPQLPYNLLLLLLLALPAAVAAAAWTGSRWIEMDRDGEEIGPNPLAPVPFSVGQNCGEQRTGEEEQRSQCHL
jgi:hypothetical protein